MKCFVLFTQFFYVKQFSTALQIRVRIKNLLLGLRRAPTSVPQKRLQFAFSTHSKSVCILKLILIYLKRALNICRLQTNSKNGVNVGGRAGIWRRKTQAQFKVWWFTQVDYDRLRDGFFFLRLIAIYHRA